MTEHIRTLEVSAEEAQARLKAFTAEMEEIVERYQLHGIIYSACMGTDNPSDPGGGALAHSCLYGCTIHSLVSLARFLAETVPLEDTAHFMEFLSGLVATKLTQAAAAVAVPHVSKYGAN